MTENKKYRNKETGEIIETVSQAMEEVRKIQKVCKEYQQENKRLKEDNRLLREALKQSKNSILDFLKGFRK
jgi:regulator of replication initiation timing